MDTNDNSYNDATEMTKLYVFTFQKPSVDLDFERELTKLAGRFNGLLNE